MTMCCIWFSPTWSPTIFVKFPRSNHFGILSLLLMVIAHRTTLFPEQTGFLDISFLASPSIWWTHTSTHDAACTAPKLCVPHIHVLTPHPHTTPARHTRMHIRTPSTRNTIVPFCARARHPPYHVQVCGEGCMQFVGDVPLCSYQRRGSYPGSTCTKNANEQRRNIMWCCGTKVSCEGCVVISESLVDVSYFIFFV